MTFLSVRAQGLHMRAEKKACLLFIEEGGFNPSRRPGGVLQPPRKVWHSRECKSKADGRLTWLPSVVLELLQKPLGLADQVLPPEVNRLGVDAPQVLSKQRFVGHIRRSK